MTDDLRKKGRLQRRQEEGQEMLHGHAAIGDRHTGISQKKTKGGGAI